MATATRSALHTTLCDLLGIRYPACQARMAFVARSGLAAAHGSPAELRAEIRRVREHTEIIAAVVDKAGAVLARPSR
jgi:hypothetical protein